MQPLKINIEWDNEVKVWIATSDDVDGLAIEASTVDTLIEKLKIVIPELMEANNQLTIDNDLPFLLDGFYARLNHDHCIVK